MRVVWALSVIINSYLEVIMVEGSILADPENLDLTQRMVIGVAEESRNEGKKSLDRNSTRIKDTIIVCD